MATLIEAVGTVVDRAAAVAPGATPENLVYIAKSLESVAGPVSVAGVVAAGDAQSARVVSEGDTQVARVAGAFSPAVIRAELNAIGAAPLYACRAWGVVSFSSGVPVLQGSGNISSVVDDGVGNMTWNFLTELPTVQYCAVGSVAVDCVWVRVGKEVKTSTQIRVGFANYGNTAEVDPSSPASLAVFC